MMKRVSFYVAIDSPFTCAALPACLSSLIKPPNGVNDCEIVNDDNADREFGIANILPVPLRCFI